jgi:hypothetical protein
VTEQTAEPEPEPVPVPVPVVFTGSAVLPPRGGGNGEERPGGD